MVLRAFLFATLLPAFSTSWVAPLLASIPGPFLHSLPLLPGLSSMGQAGKALSPLSQSQEERRERSCEE